ncbi:MAG: sulfatase [Verrucomicrobiales bacterium]|nr:sulfatase [Verrucomicrobiales bacterium]
MKYISAIFLYLLPLALIADDGLNVMWIISDDLSPELSCYGYPGVDTPNIDRIATSGVRFMNAFATAPVCSASRTAFQTGRYQTSIGGHHHDTRDKKELPESVKTITEMMQEAGYFVSNGHGLKAPQKRLAKSHFNFVYDPKTFFDGSDWSQRKEGQPFFAQVQIKEPHRKFHPADRSRPEAPIPPYYPDHPVTRADWDNYLHSIEILDSKVGAVLDRLDAEGLAENTIVMFFGDHGRPHVRGKQWLYEGGIRVPLIIRHPQQPNGGTVDDRLISLLDLMPSVLAETGVDIPEGLPGRNLFDPDWPGHEKLFAARDRCGDAADRIRSVRTRRYKYIKNFHPEIPYMQHSGYKRSQYPVDTLMRVLHGEGKWAAPFMAVTRPEEELYDLKNDPHEMNNLAGLPGHQETLKSLREDLDVWIEKTGDQGAVDESKTVDLQAVMREKRASYERNLQKRGLAPDITDKQFLEAWEKELGVQTQP